MKSRLVGEAKVDAEGRVDVSLQLTLLCEVVRVVVEELHVVGVEVDDGLVGGDALGGDGLGEDSAATGDWIYMLVMDCNSDTDVETHRGS